MICLTYEEHLGLKIRVAGAFVDHIRCCVGDAEVEQPVRGCCHGQGFGSHFQWEQLAGDDPCHWTPGACEEKDVEAYEGNGNLLCRQVVGACGCSCDGHNILADTHPDRAHEQKVAAAHLLDEVEPWQCRDYVHAAVEGQ